jgi:hypothetical protein
MQPAPIAPLAIQKQQPPLRRRSIDERSEEGLPEEFEQRISQLIQVITQKDKTI